MDGEIITSSSSSSLSLDCGVSDLVNDADLFDFLNLSDSGGFAGEFGMSIGTIMYVDG